MIDISSIVLRGAYGEVKRGRIDGLSRQLRGLQGKARQFGGGTREPGGVLFNIIIVVVLAVILTISLFTSRGNIALSKQHIIGLEIGSKFDNNAQRYGKPVEIESIGNKKKYKFIHSLGLVVSETGTISSISIQGENSEFTTEKGIRPGDSVEEVIESYGVPHKQYSDQGAQVKVYRDRKNKLSLEFWTVENKVHTIRLKDNKSE